MKSSIVMVAVAACCAAPLARAQSVTIYGIADLAVERLNNVAPSGSSLYRMPGLAGSVPSRLGFRGSEDLGDGLRAVFTLEQGMGLDAGSFNQGGRAFGRQAFVGLSGSWGSLTFGRQYTMLFWSLIDADILGPNVYGIASLDNYLPNARVDNSVAYRGSFSGLTVGATYSVGRDTVNAGPSPAGTNCAGENGADSQACREWSVLAKYDAPSWGVALAVDQLHGGAGAFAGLTSSAMKDTRTSLNGYLKFGDAKIGAGVIHRKNDASAATPKSDLVYLGAAYPVTPLFILDGELAQLKFMDSANKARLFALRGTYLFSKRTALYATAGRIANDGTLALSASGAAAGGNPAAGTSQLGFATGIRHSF